MICICRYVDKRSVYFFCFEHSVSSSIYVSILSRTEKQPYYNTFLIILYMAKSYSLSDITVWPLHCSLLQHTIQQCRAVHCSIDFESLPMPDLKKLSKIIFFGFPFPFFAHHTSILCPYVIFSSLHLFYPPFLPVSLFPPLLKSFPICFKIFPPPEGGGGNFIQPCSNVNQLFCEEQINEKRSYNRGGISFLTGGSFSTSWMWKMSPGKLPCPRSWNNIKKIFSNIPWRKQGKNVNLFHPKHELFKKSNRKSITLFKCRDV